MATPKPSRTWPVLRNVSLLGAIAALGALNWHIWITPKDLRPIALNHTSPSGLGISSDMPEVKRASRAPANYTETLARPMFRADRKPFVAEVPPAPPVEETAPEPQSVPPPQQPPDGLKLVGVMRDGDGRDRALLKSTQSPNATWLAIGDEFDGWRIAAIAPSTVTLSADATSIKLDLYPVVSSQAATPAP